MKMIRFLQVTTVLGALLSGSSAISAQNERNGIGGPDAGYLCHGNSRWAENLLPRSWSKGCSYPCAASRLSELFPHVP